MNFRINLFKAVLLAFIFTTACKNEDTVAVESEIEGIDDYLKSIDKLPISESFYIIQVDSKGEAIDTVALRKLKYDEDENLIYEHQFSANIESFDYYDAQNGVIYSKVNQNNEMMLDFKTDMKDGLIVSANYNVYDGGQVVDGAKMDYKYTFDKGKKVELVIDSGDDFNTIEHYNSNGKAVLNFSMTENDTVERTKFIYNENNILKEKKFKNFIANEETIYEYEGKNNLVKETFIKNGEKKGVTTYEKDEDGNYLSFTEEL